VSEFSPLRVTGNAELQYLVLRLKGKKEVTLCVSERPDGDAIIAAKHGDAVFPATDTFLEIHFVPGEFSAAGASTMMFELIRLLAPGLPSTSTTLQAAAQSVLKGECPGLSRGSLAVVAAALFSRALTVEPKTSTFGDVAALFAVPAKADKTVAACRIMQELHNFLSTLFQQLKARNFYIHLPFTWSRVEKARAEHFPAAASGSGPTVASESPFRGEDAAPGAETWLVDAAGAGREVSESEVKALWSELDDASAAELAAVDAAPDPEFVEARLKLPAVEGHRSISEIASAFVRLTELAETLPETIAMMRRGQAELQPAERVIRVLARAYKAELGRGLFAPLFAEFSRSFERLVSVLRKSGVTFRTGDWLEQVVASLPAEEPEPALPPRRAPVAFDRWVIHAPAAS
jgi:hypothetical protein